MSQKLLSCVALAALTLGLAATVPDSVKADGSVRHVLLISIDGMHALDFINCANGIAGANGGAPYCPNLAGLKANGVNYLDASTSKPSDSFPGLMALVSGGSPRSVGAFYDVAYDRSLSIRQSSRRAMALRAAPALANHFNRQPAPRPSLMKASISIRPSSTAALPSATAASTRSIPGSWSAIRPAAVRRFIRGTSCGPIRSSEWCTRAADIRLGPTNILPIPRCPAPATAAISMTITRPRSIRFRCRCRACGSTTP